MGVLTKDTELSESLFVALSITLDALFTAYATGLHDIPKTVATGCVMDLLDENDVEVDGSVVAVGVEIAATVLGRLREARSTSAWVRDLYVVGLGNSLGQLAARWSTKNFLHFTQTVIVIQEFSFSVEELRALFAGSKRDGRCLAVVVWNTT